MFLRRIVWRFYLVAISFEANVIMTDGENIPMTCPHDYDYYGNGNRCYKIYTDDPKTWQEAREQCQREGSDLLVVKDKETSDFIKGLVTSANRLDERFWLGLGESQNSSVVTQRYRWIDGNLLEDSKWGVNEPSNPNPNKIDCIRLEFNDNPPSGLVPSWYVSPCAELYSYICEKSLKVYPACPSGYVSYIQNESESKKCIKFVHSNGKKNWEQARGMCQQEGGDLTIIADESYNTFIKSRLKDNQRYFLGFKNVPPFTWIDGSLLEEYSQWAQDQPDYEEPDVCGEISIITRFNGWNDIPCTAEYSYICEQGFHQPFFCPGAGWTLGTTSRMCYKIQTDETTFGDSRVRCQTEGGDLVTTTNDDHTEEYVASLLDEYETPYWIDASPTGGTQCLSVAIRADGTRSLQPKNCKMKHPSICQREPSIDYPVLECPHGYSTYVADKPSWRITCLMMENNEKKSFSDAERGCQSRGGGLYTKASESDVNSFIIINLLIHDTLYWYSNPDCIAWRYLMGFRRKPCSDEYNYMCYHWGNIRYMVSLKELISTDKNVYSLHNGLIQNTSLADVCQVSDLTQLHSLHKWTQTSTHVSIITDVNLTRLTMGDQNAKCLSHNGQNECCVKGMLNNVGDFTRPSSIKVTLPMEKLLPCLCPGKVSHEIIDSLKNMTTPTNGSTAPNKLCPCRCDTKNIDFNPSPQALAEMISNIQKELKVDKEQMSLKRNKKISARDRRTESKVIGYVGIVMCLIPFCLLVAVDLSGVITFISKK